MDSTPCPQCGAGNDASAGFCSACGASLAAQVQCPTCNTSNPVGNRFCNRCGGSLEQAGWSGPTSTGGVVDGVWERGPDEIIRRVDPEDARRYLGTRTVRVPGGAVGVVLVDGVIERVLPPGEQTSLGVFERIANFFLGRERTAFYLVDQRPFPVPFVVQTRSRGGQVVKSQVLVTFTLPRGDRAALASFIANVLGPRPAYTAGDLYNLLRPEVVRVAQDALERAVTASPDGQPSYPDVEAAIRTALVDTVAARYGLTVDATLAPLTRIVSVSFRLGAGDAPAVRPCVECKRELPVSLRFCDACGARQPAVVEGSEPASVDSPLYTSDGQQIELELVLRLQGRDDVIDGDALAPAVVGAASAQLRDRTLAALAAPGGLAGLEAAMAPAVAAGLASLGLTVVALAVVDIRSKTGRWLLAAHADLERAREDVKLGRAWIDQRDGELDLEELTLQRVLRQQQLSRDHAFARDEATQSDRERRDELAARQAALDVAGAQRAGATRAAGDAIEQERQRRAQDHAIAQRGAAVDADLSEIEKRKRLELSLSQAAEHQQLDKLRAMAEIDREGAAQEHAHELEKRRMLHGLSPEEMIAVQAGELAKSDGGGAAWANVLAQRASADAERRHADETRALYERQQATTASLAEKAMGAMAQVAGSRAEAAPVIAGGGAPVVTVASTSAEAAAARACKSCGAGLKVDARFCGACGASQV